MIGCDLRCGNESDSFFDDCERCPGRNRDYPFPGAIADRVDFRYAGIHMDGEEYHENWWPTGGNKSNIIFHDWAGDSCFWNSGKIRLQYKPADTAGTRLCDCCDDLG